MKIVKGDSILEVSGKAYEVIYKSHGYSEYLEDAKKPGVKDEIGAVRLNRQDR